MHVFALLGFLLLICMFPRQMLALGLMLVGLLGAVLLFIALVNPNAL